MKKMTKTLSYLLFIPLLISCSAEKPAGESAEEKTLNHIQNVQYELISQKGLQEIKITDIDFDTASLHNDTKGILVSFRIQASEKAIKDNYSKGFNSYFIDITCQTDKGERYSHRDEIFKSSEKKKWVRTNKDFFISHATDRTLEMSFPYRMLKMEEGGNDILIDIEVYPAKFIDDTSAAEFKVLDRVSAQPEASTRVKLKVKAPKLYKATIQVNKFKMNTTVCNPAKFDFAVTGSGHPDLFWEVYCGNDYMYYSPVAKNQTQYDKKYFTQQFFCTKEDLLHIAVVDYDNGPFNTQDDIIETWKGKITDLSTSRPDTFNFGNLEYLIVETKVE
jgi:hypothetical protein